VLLYFCEECITWDLRFPLIRLQAGWSRIHIPVGPRDLSLLQNIQTGTGAHPASYLMGTGFLSWEVKPPGCAVNHSPPCSAKVKNEWSCISAHPVCRHSVNRENRTSFFEVLTLTLLRIRVIWDVTLCCWVSDPLCFEGLCCRVRGPLCLTAADEDNVIFQNTGHHLSIDRI
jgi:hypothetical protein